MYKLNAESKGLIAHGVSTCAGCGLELVIRNVLDVMGENTIVVIPPGCAALFSGFGKETVVKVAGFQGNLEATAAYAAGIKAGFEAQGRDDIKVLGFAGDGGTVDIGIQALSGMMERGDKVIYVCYDNEAYMNTGIQGSGSTPLGASTTTTPTGKTVGRKNMMEIAAAHNIPYVASASVAYIKDLRKKVAKAKECNGPAYLHVHTPCPTGWSYDPSKTIEVARAAVETGAWLLYEIENGKKKISRKLTNIKPIENYIRLQKRFSSVSEDEMASMQKHVTESYNQLIKATEDA